MAGAVVNDYLFGDDLEAVMNALEEDVGLQEEFLNTANNIEDGKFVCNICEKVCKSKGWLTRHMKKHSATVKNERVVQCLTQEHIFNILSEEKVKVENNSCYNTDLCTKLKETKIEGDDMWLIALDLWSAFQKPYEKLLKNKDAENFYSFCYSNIVAKAQEFLSVYPDHMATILLCKLTNRLLHLSKGDTECKTSESTTDLSEKERHGLYYITGYIMHKLYKKMKNSPKWNTSTNQQIMSLLNATKLHPEETKENFTFMSNLDRGGLWFITEDLQKLMHLAENYFRKNTTSLIDHVIDYRSICKSITDDSFIQKKWEDICTKSEVEIAKHISKDVLYSVINLFVRIRSFTHAKNIVQKFKRTQQTAKDKALRKNIKRSCVEEK